MKKRILSILLILVLVLSTLGFAGCVKTEVGHVERDDWATDVKAAVNDFIDLYGNQSKQYNENSYVVSDFDNTAAIFDMCEQFMIYQAEVMGYGFTPAELPTILSSGLGDMDKDLTELGYGKGSYSDWIDDIVAAYTYLYNTYGPFKALGCDEKTSQTIQADPMWAEFIVKMMNMYDLIGDNESTDVSYPWITYWYTGMTEDEVYTLAKESHAKYRQVDTSKKTMKTSDAIQSKVGPVQYTYVEGVQVTDNIVEMWKNFDKAGIDVWVCTASECDIIRAAVDEFGLHDYCTGLIGMTPSRVNGKLSYTYDYETGYAWYANENGLWSRGNVASKAQTQGKGKTISVQNICYADYGCGPLAGFMDSTGDFNFCTEFNNLKLVICFNRADRKVTDGGSLIAELAIYQRENLGYDLEKANKAGDTLYVLQGRDENGKRSLRNSNKTVKLGETEEKLFKNEQNEAVYEYMVQKKMSTKEILTIFSVKSSENALGFKYGFLDKYDGYHSID